MINSSQIIGWMIIACLLFAVFLIFAKPIKTLAKICINSVIGVSALFITNFLLAPIGLGVGINAVTALITGILGIPGFISLYLINYILK